MPVTVVPTSSATVAIDTFMTELSSVIRNWPDARVSRITDAPVATAAEPLVSTVMGAHLVPLGAVCGRAARRKGCRISPGWRYATRGASILSDGRASHSAVALEQPVLGQEEQGVPIPLPRLLHVARV